MNPRLAEILDRRMGLNAQARADRAARAAENRRRFPVVASLVDECVDVFGPVKVVAGREPDGRSFGVFGPRAGDICVQAVISPDLKPIKVRK